MKFLLVLIVVMVGVWIWRSNRAAEKAEEEKERRPRSKSAGAIEMGRCDLCGMHCPDDDLVKGRRGAYCSIQHRDQAEA